MLMGDVHMSSITRGKRRSHGKREFLLLFEIYSCPHSGDYLDHHHRSTLIYLYIQPLKWPPSRCRYITVLFPLNRKVQPFSFPFLSFPSPSFLFFSYYLSMFSISRSPVDTRIVHRPSPLIPPKFFKTSQVNILPILSPSPPKKAPNPTPVCEAFSYLQAHHPTHPKIGINPSPTIPLSNTLPAARRSFARVSSVHSKTKLAHIV